MRRNVVVLLFAIATQAAGQRAWDQPADASAHLQPAGATLSQDVLASHVSRQERGTWFARSHSLHAPMAGSRDGDVQGRLINGGPAARGQFPWQAYVLLGSSNFCGGSLISSLWILTSAVCVSGFATFTVTLGSTSALEPQQGSVSLTSRYWIMHTGYGGAFIQSNIAIVRLPSPVSFSEFISPVRLPKYSQESQTFTGMDAIISGFGRISSYNFTNSATLQYAQVEIISNEECVFNFPFTVTETTICSLGEGGISACDGDNGGPMVITEEDGISTLVGVMSHNLINCPEGGPVVFERVTSYLRWIETYSGVTIIE